MPKQQSFADEVGQKLGYQENITSDGIVRWDGERLYVKEIVHRNGVKTDERRRDVTAEIENTVTAATFPSNWTRSCYDRSRRSTRRARSIRFRDST
jgi:hypothetical protein